MSKLLDKPLVRTLPVFYAQATATLLRRIVFSVFLLWALREAALTLVELRRGGLSMWAAVAGAFVSFLGSMVFIGLLVLTWDWLARHLKESAHRLRRSPRNVAAWVFFVSTIADAAVCVLALASIPFCFWRYGLWWGFAAVAVSLVTFTALRHILRFAFSFVLLQIDPTFFDGPATRS